MPLPLFRKSSSGGQQERPDLPADRMRILERIVSAASGPYEVQDLIERLVAEMTEALGIRWAAIKLRRGEEETAETMVRGPGPGAGTVPRALENTAFYLVLHSGEPLVVEDLASDERFAATRSEEARTLLGVPVEHRGERVGVLTLVDRLDGRPFTEPDARFVSLLASEAAALIDNARLLEEALERRAMEHERTLAESVWRRFLPSSLPPLEGFDLAVRCLPARRVGGDYYDVISLDEGRVLLTLADVSGSGMSAALLMSNLQAVLRASLRVTEDLGYLIALVNDHLCSTTDPDRFATLFAGILDIASGKVRFVNAGQNPPILLIDDGLVRLEATAPPVGFLAETEYEVSEVELAPRDMLAAYSDGITEACDRDETMFEEDRLLEILREGKGDASGELLTRVLSAVDRWCEGSHGYQDDRTLLILQRE